MVAGILSDISTAFVLGLLTPLTAACVLPLYPGFLAYLSGRLSGKESERKTIALFGIIIASGVILFMFLLGLVFTTILQASLTNVIGVVSPIAFGLLIIVSLLLIFDIDVGRFLPKGRTPLADNPFASAFIYGFFFGGIVVPCNPLFIAALFTRTISAIDYLGNLVRFSFFGIGMAFPLLLFSLLSATSSRAIIGLITRYRRAINLAAGVIMLPIAVYYLVFVFKVFG